MQYLEKDILFGNVKSFGVSLKVPGPITAYGKYAVNEQGYIEHHGYDYVVNAIDIHWGGAQLQNSGKIINTTAQLLELIDSISPGVYENFATVDSVNDANHRILDLRNTIEALEIPSIEGLATDERVDDLTFRINDLYEIVQNLNIPNTDGLLTAEDALNTYVTKEAATRDFQPKGEYANRIDLEEINARIDDISLPDLSKYVTSNGLNIKLSEYARISDVGSMIMSFVDDAPEAFDTLREVATWIGNHERTALTMNEEINKKAYRSEIEDMLTRTSADQLFVTKNQHTTDISKLATKTELQRVDEALQDLNIPSISGLVHEEEIADMLTKTEAASTYLTAHQDISNLATKDELNAVNSRIDDLTIPEISGLATESYVDTAVSTLNSSILDGISEEYGSLNKLKGYVDEKNSQIDNTITTMRIQLNTKASVSDLTSYVLKSQLPDFNEYAKLSDVANAINALLNGAGADYDTFKEIENWIHDHIGQTSEALEKVHHLEEENELLKEEIRLLKESISSIGGETVWDSYNANDIENNLSRNNATIRLMDNVTINHRIDLPTSDKLSTNKIDLNGKTMTFESDGSDILEYAISMSSGQELTVVGEGTIQNNVENSPIFLLTEMNGYDYDDSYYDEHLPKLDIYDGTYIVNNPDEDDSELSSDYAAAIRCEYGNVNIYGGTFKSNDRPAYLLIEDKVNSIKGFANITVYGGTFYDFNPQDNSSRENHTNYLAPGRTVVSEIVDIDGILHTVYTVVEVNS